MRDQPTQPLLTAEFSIKSTLHEARKLLPGSKGPLWVISATVFATAMLIGFIVMSGVGYYLFQQMQPTDLPAWLDFTLQVVFSIAIYVAVAPFVTGAIMVAVRRARNETVHYASGFEYIRFWLSAAGVLIILAFVILAINSLFNLPLSYFVAQNSAVGIYGMLALNTLAVLYSISYCIFGIPALVDRKLSIWRAFGFSCHLVHPLWKHVFGLMTICYLILLLTMAPAFFGVMCPVIIGKVIGIAATVALSVWLVPYLHLLIGVAYHRLADSHAH